MFKLHLQKSIGSLDLNWHWNAWNFGFVFIWLLRITKQLFVMFRQYLLFPQSIGCLRDGWQRTNCVPLCVSMSIIGQQQIVGCNSMSGGLQLMILGPSLSYTKCLNLMHRKVFYISDSHCFF